MNELVIEIKQLIKQYNKKEITFKELLASIIKKYSKEEFNEGSFELFYNDINQYLDPNQIIRVIETAGDITVELMQEKGEFLLKIHSGFNPSYDKMRESKYMIDLRIPRNELPRLTFESANMELGVNKVFEAVDRSGGRIITNNHFNKRKRIDFDKEYQYYEFTPEGELFELGYVNKQKNKMIERHIDEYGYYDEEYSISRERNGDILERFQNEDPDMVMENIWEKVPTKQKSSMKLK